MIEWYVSVLRRYVDFNGRAGRSEYWWFALANAIVAVALNILGKVGSGMGLGGVLMVPYYVYLLAVLLPSLSVGVRRLHDTGRSGWWLLLALVPVIGDLVLIVFFILDSTPGDNKYGPHPAGARMVAGVTA
jgi:uncharacterized membrane protein YhaH (DUF805 family)